MTLIAKEIDFRLYKDTQRIRKFIVYENDGTTPHDMSGASSVILHFRPESDTEGAFTTITGVVGGTNNNEVEFTFTTTHTATDVLHFYKIIETPSVGDPFILILGNIQVVDENLVTFSLDTYIQDGLPVGLEIDKDNKNNLVRYWRAYLQPAFDIDDVDLYVESAWPFLANVLIAKLVIYNIFIKKLKEGLISLTSSESSSSSSGDIKSIETGPTRVEFYDSGEKSTKLLSQSASGAAPIDVFKEEICMLSKRLKVYIPVLCETRTADFITPIKAERPETWDEETYLLKFYS